MQNTHDLLVGTLSIGIPSLILLHLGGKYSTENGKIASYILYQLIVTALN